MNTTFGRVIPGLSVRSKDLVKRLENRSFQVDDTGKVYSVDQKVLETLRMDRAELFRSHLKDTQTIGELSKVVKAEAKSKAEADKAKYEADLIAKAKAEAIAEQAKAKANG